MECSIRKSWHSRLRDRLDPASTVPLYKQLIQLLIREIEGGRLNSGTYLPSSRDMARTLKINRKTVVFVYQDLIAQGWLTAASKRGTMVSSALPQMAEALHDRGLAATPVTAAYQFALPPERPLATLDGPGLKLDEGAPDGRLFPIDVLTRAYRTAAVRAVRNNGLQYRDPRGVPALREGIASMLRTQRGLDVTADNICITRGSQNGIFLSAQVLLQPGDTVIVEHLSYEPAVAAFKALGAKILPVPIDDWGIDVDAVETACRREKVRAVFVTPHHQFPTTVALRPERRLRLLELARQFGFAIIEDDYDHEFHFQLQPLLPMASYAPDQVLYVASLSKLLIPALRIGYVAAPTAVIDAIAHRVSLTDGMGDPLIEHTVATLIELGELRKHVRRVCHVYMERRRFFAAQLDRELSFVADYRLPDGGLAFWLRFNTDQDRLEARARDMGLRFAPSRSFMTDDAAPRGLRIGFASLSDAEAQHAIAVLREAAA